MLSECRAARSNECRHDLLHQPYVVRTCKMVYKGFYDLGPATLNSLFVLYVPKRTLRSGDELRIESHFCQTTFGQKNIAFRGTLYWNSLPLVLKSSQSPDAFKLALKKYPGFD